MTKRRRKQVIDQEPAWQSMSNAAFASDFEASMKAEDSGYVGVFKNNLYQVIMREYPYEGNDTSLMVSWLVIRRIDSFAIHDWRHFQHIKNDLCGPEREGIELYPAESRLVDASNQYHLFVLPLGVRLPFGYAERDVSDSTKIESWNKNKQRDFVTPPKDLNAHPDNVQTISIMHASKSTT